MSHRALIYCRISRDKTGAGLGVARQRADCEALAASLGWSVVGCYSDNDVSAYRGTRRGYKAMLADLESGRADAVLAWHTDRLHRSPAELERYIEVCDKRAIPTHCVKAGVLDLATASGRMMARITGAVARHESEHRGERVTAARQQQAQDGRYGGGLRPFGYTRDGMQLVAEEATVIRDATGMLLRGGNLRAAIRVFNDSGLTTTMGRSWTPISVKQVLARPRNAGLAVYQGKVQGPGGWPAIISDDEHQAVCAVLRDPTRRTSPGTQPRWLGSLIYKCGVCGEVLVVGRSGSAVRYPAYRCRSAERGQYSSNGRTGRHVTCVAEPLDEFVEGMLLAGLTLPENVAHLHPDPDPGVDTGALRSELLALEQNRNALAERLSAGQVTLSQFDRFNADMAIRQERIETELARLTTSSPAAELVTAGDPVELWAAQDLEWRRGIVRDLLDVTVSPAKPGRPPGVRGSRFDRSRVDVKWRRDPTPGG